MAVVAAALEAPFGDRPSEGQLLFNVELSPMASPAFEAGRPGPDAIALARLVERALRQSKAVDQEALCVQAGKKARGAAAAGPPLFPRTTLSPPPSLLLSSLLPSDP
jgi:exosome complex RNA-binding protein Rrp42 (RNase PH superfamily)